MDPADIFRQGFGQVAPRQNPVFMGHPQHHMVQFQQQPPPPPAFRKPVQQTEETSDGDGSSHRIAHTLTACCRCRQVPILLVQLDDLSYMLMYSYVEENSMRSDFAPLFAV